MQWSNQLLLRVRAAMISLIFEKSLRATSQGEKTGNILSLMSNDTQRIIELSFGLLASSSTARRAECLLARAGLHMLWSAPIIVIVGTYLMWRQVGVASIAGLAVFVSRALPQIAESAATATAQIFSFPFAGVFIGRQLRAQKNALQETDKRVSVINEFIQGIRVVKYAAASLRSA